MADDLYAAVQAEFDKHTDDSDDTVDSGADDVVDSSDESSDDAASDSADDAVASDETDDSTHSASTEEENLPPEIAEALKELGADKPQEPGKRANRIPQPRVQAMVKKKLLKMFERLSNDHKTKIDREYTPRITQAQQLEAQLRAIVNAEDPQRVMLWLASQNERYKQYALGQAGAGAQQVDQDPEPKPDHQFEDGSVGYSPKQYKAWQDWNKRQLLNEFEQRQQAKDYEAQRQQQFYYQEHEKAKTTVERQIAQAEKTWGKVFVDDMLRGGDSDVLKFLRANPDMSFEAGVAAVLMPKAKQSALDELAEKGAKRKAAASASTSGGSVKIARPQTDEDAVREALREAGLIK